MTRPEPYNPMEELRRQVKKQEACKEHTPINRPANSVEEAESWSKAFENCSEDTRDEHLRFLALHDLYFLLTYLLLSENDAAKQKKKWHFERCREIERADEGIIDIGTRGSGKSLRKTFAKLIQEVLKNPEETHCILSHKADIAHSFLKPIKETFEKNMDLLRLFPDILWKEPKRDAPSWGLQSGLTVKRKSISRPEATIEAWGLTDGLPTRKHYDKLWYDDIQKGPVSEYMIQQIDDQWQSSLGLSATQPPRWTMTGVFFRGGSIYETFIDRAVGLPRIRPAVNVDGTSPIWSDEEVAAIKKNMTPGVWACEWLVDPSIKMPGEGFEIAWVKYHDGIDLLSANIYIIVDPGQGNKNKSALNISKGSRCAIAVLALTPKKQYALLDAVMGYINMIERVKWTMIMHRQYSQPGKPLKVGYEKYGLQGDVDYLKTRQKEEGYFFPIFELTTPHLGKDERIPWLMPVIKNGDFLFPRSIPQRRVGNEELDVLKYFFEKEFIWPATKFKDLFDAMSWIMYKPFGAVFPEGYADGSVRRKELDWSDGEFRGTWMSS